MFSSLWISCPSSRHLWIGMHIGGLLAQTVLTHIPIPLIRKAGESTEASRDSMVPEHLVIPYLIPGVFGPNLWRHRPPRGALHRLHVALWLTCGGPGTALPGHGAVLLVLVSTHTQEGAFHVFTEGFAAHATEQFTFIYIWKREHRSSKTHALLQRALRVPGCAKASSVCWKHGDRREQPNPAASEGGAAWCGLQGRSGEMQNQGSKFQFWLLRGTPDLYASTLCTLAFFGFLFPNFFTGWSLK